MSIRLPRFKLVMNVSDPTFATVFDGQIVLPAPLNLPNGTQVKVVPVEQAERELISAADWPEGYFAATAGQLAGEQFERPEQGTQADRDNW